MTELEILRAIQSDLATLKTDVVAVKLGVHSHSTQLNMLQQDVRMVRIAINEMERTRVSAGEVEVLHEDVNRVQQGPSRFDG